MLLHAAAGGNYREFTPQPSAGATRADRAPEELVPPCEAVRPATPPTGPAGYRARALSAPTARSAARRTRGPYERATNALGSSSGLGLVNRCRPAPSRPVCVWRTCRAHRSGRSSVGIGSTPRSDGHSGGSSDSAGRRTRGYGAVRAGAGGGVVAGCAIRALQEQASQTYPLSLPPSRSPHGWCSATKATKAVSHVRHGAGTLPQPRRRYGARSVEGSRAIQHHDPRAARSW
jgi:hypothetical protein